MKMNSIRTGLIVLFIFMSTGSLTACANSPSKTLNDPITVYHLDSNENEMRQYLLRFRDFYPDAEFELVVFEDAAEMDEVLINELNVGEGPDIVIFTEETELDVLRMAKNGAFVSLNEMMAHDGGFKPDDYLKPAITSGNVDGKQYFLPLTIKIPFVVYDADGEYLGFTPAPVLSYADFMESVIENIGRTKDERFEGVLYVDRYVGYQVHDNNLISPMLSTSQVLALSENNKVENFNEDEFRQIVEWLYTYYNECYVKSKNIVSAKGTFALAFVENMQYYYYYSFQDFVYNLWWINNCYGYRGVENIGFSVFSEIGSDDVVAVLASYGVITNNAHPLAYDFLRVAMDSFFLHGQGALGSPMKISNIELMMATRTWGPNFRRLPDGSVFTEKPLSDALMDSVREILRSIDKVIIPNTKLDGLFHYSFAPYFENKRSYEDCSSDFVEKLNLYLSE